MNKLIYRSDCSKSEIKMYNYKNLEIKYDHVCDEC